MSKLLKTSILALWATLVNTTSCWPYVCVIWPNEVWGLVSIYLKSLPLNTTSRNPKLITGGRKNHFLRLQAVDGITTFKCFYFLLHNFWATCHMIIIFSRTRRAMFEEASRYIQHFHTACEKVFRVTLKNVFSRNKHFFQRFRQNILRVGYLEKSIYSLFSIA